MGKGREYISFEIEYSYSIFLPALPKSLYVVIFIIDILPCDVNYLCMTFNHFKSYYDLNKTIEYFDMGYI